MARLTMDSATSWRDGTTWQVRMPEDISQMLGAAPFKPGQDISVLPGASTPRAKLNPSAVPALARPHTGFRHEAFLYRDDEEFLSATVSFIRDAVALGQPVMVALVKPRIQLLRTVLGQHAGDVDFVDMGQLGANPARIIPAWLDFLQRNPDRPVRGIGEPVWPGRRPEEVVECQLHEALLNVAIDPDIPLWLRCPYDVSALPAPIALAALDSHPTVMEVGGHRGSTSYGGLHTVDSIFRAELPPEPSDATMVRFGRSDLDLVRAQVSRSAWDAGLDGDRCRSLTSAIIEIASNSIRHGGGQGELRTWTRADALVCQISDRGQLEDPLAGRRPPATREQEERGLWLVNKVSDLVQLRSTTQGSVARVFTWL